MSATLTVIETGAPASINAVSNSFPLQARVVDANNNAVPGIRVVLSAPPTGPVDYSPEA